jgi:hypothetical protein
LYFPLIFRNKWKHKNPVKFANVFVDNGATHSSIKKSDVGKTTLRGPIQTIYGYKNAKYTEQTYVKFITIDKLRTKCFCTVDERVIGLDVIHRYTHTIDYRNKHPRIWKKRSDMKNHFDNSK